MQSHALASIDYMYSSVVSVSHLTSLSVHEYINYYMYMYSSFKDLIRWRH